MGTLIQTSKQAKQIKAGAVVRAKQLRLPADTVTSFQVQCASALRLALPKELKARGAVVRGVDMDGLAESLARRLAHLPEAPKNEWISTQEAANRCGFSRPFVAALHDSGTYPGKVHRTAGGHRKVLAREFEALVAQASVSAPKNLAQARKAMDVTTHHETPAAPRKERKQSQVRANALATKLGLLA